MYTWKETTDKDADYLKSLAHKSAFDVSSSFPVKLEMRCVFFLMDSCYKTMRRRNRACRLKSCSVLRKWSICDVHLSHGVVLECGLNAAYFTGLCSKTWPRFFTTIKIVHSRKNKTQITRRLLHSSYTA